MMMNCDALRDLGLLDEGFFLYFEETDWCVRARQRGWTVGLVPSLGFVHTGAYSTSQEYLKNLRHYCASVVRFYGKHRGRAAQVVAQLALACEAIAAVPYLTVFGWLKPSQRHKAHERVEWLLTLVTAVRAAGYTADE